MLTEYVGDLTKGGALLDQLVCLTTGVCIALNLVIISSTEEDSPCTKAKIMTGEKGDIVIIIEIIEVAKAMMDNLGRNKNTSKLQNRLNFDFKL